MARLAEGSAIPGARFVDPTVLARIGKLDLLARTVVDGFINGLHRAPYFGASIDFAEHRGYVPGDDIRRVDWRLYARTDKYFVKQYEADTNTNFSVLLDVSKSMGFTSGGVSKLEYSCFLGACLAYLAHRQRDRVGLITFDDDIVNYVPVSAKHFNVVLHTLDRSKPERAGNLITPITKMAEHFKRRSVLALISDFYEEPDVILEAIKPLRFLGQRPDGVPRPRSGGDRVQVRRCVELRGSRERRTDSGGPGGAGRTVPGADEGAHRRPVDEVLRAPDRLHDVEHVEAARPRALQLPVDAREDDEGAMTRSSIADRRSAMPIH